MKVTLLEIFVPKKKHYLRYCRTLNVAPPLLVENQTLTCYIVFFRLNPFLKI